MLGKLLGKNNKKKFFLELSEDEISAIPEPSEAPAPQVSEATVETAAEAGAKAADKAAKPSAKKAAAPAITALSPAISKAAAAMPQEAAQPAPMADPVDLIRNAIAAAGNQSAADEAETETFDYTTPATTAPRRRPGPSMSPFKSMAKNLKKTSF